MFLSPAPRAFRISFERAAESKLWAIGHWGGKALSNPYELYIHLRNFDCIDEAAGRVKTLYETHAWCVTYRSAHSLVGAVTLPFIFVSRIGQTNDERCRCRIAQRTCTVLFRSISSSTPNFTGHTVYGSVALKVCRPHVQHGNKKHCNKKAPRSHFA